MNTKCYPVVMVIASLVAGTALAAGKSGVQVPSTNAEAIGAAVGASPGSSGWEAQRPAVPVTQKAVGPTNYVPASPSDELRDVEWQSQPYLEDLPVEPMPFQDDTSA